MTKRRAGVAEQTVVPCCKCSKEVAIDFYYSEPEKKRRLKAKKALCLDCYKKEVNTAAAEYNKRKGYVTLYGTQNQISWAERLREVNISHIVSTLIGAGQNEFAKRAEKFLGAQRAAKFWIEYREVVQLEELIQEKINEVLTNEGVVND